MNFLDWFAGLNLPGFAYRDLIGQDRWNEWTVTRTSWTDVGTPTVTARFRMVGRKCESQILATPSTTIATTSGTSYTNLPLTAKGLAGGGTVFDITAGMPLGTCGVSVSNSRLYMPTIAATGSLIGIEFSYEV